MEFKWKDVKSGGRINADDINNIAHAVIDLDANGPGKSIKHIEDGEGDGSIKTKGAGCEVIGPYNAALGSNNTAGGRGYYWNNIDLSEKKIYLCKDSPSNPTINGGAAVDPAFEAPAYGAGDKLYVRNGRQHLFLKAKVVRVASNVIVYEGELDITEIGEGGEFTVCVPKKPDVGLVVLGENAFATGDKNHAFGKNAFATGTGNLVTDYGTASGKNNAAGNSSFVSGYENIHSGNAGASFGWSNKVGEDRTLTAGQQNTATGGADNAAFGGFNTLKNAAYSVAGGAANSVSDGESVAVFGSENDAKTVTGGAAIGMGNVIGKAGKDTKAAIALGRNNYTEFDNAIDVGHDLVAGGDDQIVVGRYNKPEADHLFQVGCGDESKRKNAFYIDKAGNVSAGEGNKFKGVTDGAAVGKENTVGRVGSNVTDSIAIGQGNYAEFNHAFVMGHHLVAGGSNTFVLGRYNNPKSDHFFEIGNGTSETNRKNILFVDRVGNLKVTGTITDGFGHALGDIADRFFTVKATVNMDNVSGEPGENYYSANLNFPNNGMIDFSVPPIVVVMDESFILAQSYKASSRSLDIKTSGDGELTKTFVLYFTRKNTLFNATWNL